MLMISIKHPAIVRFYGMSFNSFNHSELLKPTILMKYLKNGSLEKIIDDEKNSKRVTIIKKNRLKVQD